MIHFIADAMEWIHHYIDDFIVAGAPQSDVCKLSLRTLTQTCNILGMCINHEKTEGPANRLTVLGIEHNTSAMEMKLPPEKLEHLYTLLKHWCGRKAGSRKDLESLAEMLQHACNIVRPGGSGSLGPPPNRCTRYCSKGTSPHSVLWGHAWKGCTACCNCDNQSARNALLCHLMHYLFFASARYGFHKAHRPIYGSTLQPPSLQDWTAWFGALCSTP